MLIIDTNILYYICKLENHSPIDVGKLIKIIDEAENVEIPSVAFAEFLTKYRNRVATIRRVCAFMRQHHIEIRNDGYINFEDDTIKSLRNIRQREFNNNFKILFQRKMEVESRFCTSIFMILMITITIFECDINPYDLHYKKFELLEIIYKKNLSHISAELFKLMYYRAYNSKSPEDCIRNEFYQMTRMFISLCMPLCKEVFNKIDSDESVDVPKIIEKFSSEFWGNEMYIYKKNIDKKDTAAKYVSRKGLEYGKSINDKHLITLFEGLRQSIEKIVKDEAMNKYMYDIVHNTIANGGAFRKNDINDALILSNVREGDIMFSFDSKIRKHMEKYKEDQNEYQKSVTFINNITKM